MFVTSIIPPLIAVITNDQSNLSLGLIVADVESAPANHLWNCAFCFPLVHQVNCKYAPIGVDTIIFSVMYHRFRAFEFPHGITTRLVGDD